MCELWSQVNDTSVQTHMLVLDTAVSHSPAKPTTSRPVDNWLKKCAWPLKHKHRDINQQLEVKSDTWSANMTVLVTMQFREKQCIWPVDTTIGFSLFEPSTLFVLMLIPRLPTNRLASKCNTAFSSENIFPVQNCFSAVSRTINFLKRNRCWPLGSGSNSTMNCYGAINNPIRCSHFVRNTT